MIALHWMDLCGLGGSSSESYDQQIRSDALLVSIAPFRVSK